MLLPLTSHPTDDSEQEQSNFHNDRARRSSGILALCYRYFYRLRTYYDRKVMFWHVSVCLSTCGGRGVPTLDKGLYLPGWGTYPCCGEGVPTFNGGRGAYPGWGVPTLGRGKGYLGWTGERVHTLNGMGVSTLDGGGGTYLGQGGGGYLPLMGRGSSYLGQRGRGIYLGQGGGGGGTYLGWGRDTYLGWGERVPTFDREGVPTLDRGGTYPGQVMPRAVRLLRLPAGGLSCVNIILEPRLLHKNYSTEGWMLEKRKVTMWMASTTFAKRIQTSSATGNIYKLVDTSVCLLVVSWNMWWLVMWPLNLCYNALEEKTLILPFTFYRDFGKVAP